MPDSDIIVRQTQPEDFEAISRLSKRVYEWAPPWAKSALESHREVFPEGQFVAEERPGGRIVGMAASLIVYWDDYDVDMSWHDFTEGGTFRNHDPEGRTLYGAEVMVDPDMQGRGIGKKIYSARRELVKRLGLLRIRAGARLRGYVKYEREMTPREYVARVIQGVLGDPTISFQIKQGFKVLDVVRNYLPQDVESHGNAAIIEWLNPGVADAADFAAQERLQNAIVNRFGRKSSP